VQGARAVLLIPLPTCQGHTHTRTSRMQAQRHRGRRCRLLPYVRIG
jgi:hypothetical protein